MKVRFFFFKKKLRKHDEYLLELFQKHIKRCWKMYEINCNQPSTVRSLFISPSFFLLSTSTICRASVHPLWKNNTQFAMFTVYFSKINKCCVCVCVSPHHSESFTEQHLHPVDNNWRIGWKHSKWKKLAFKRNFE